MQYVHVHVCTYVWTHTQVSHTWEALGNMWICMPSTGVYSQWQGREALWD